VCLAFVVVWLPGCGSGESPAVAARSTAGEAAAPVETAPVAVDTRPRIVALGDSLTAGLGLDEGQAYPAILQERLDAAGIGLRVVNAGVSGDTSAGGLSRLEWALQGDVRLLIVALGGNDALRALPVEELRRNLSKILVRAKKGGIPTILTGMEAPTNLGHDYTAAFRSAYRSLAKEHGVVFLPFLLEGVAGVEHLNQRDGIHPTAEGARIVADQLWPLVEPLARKVVTQAPARASRG
jgi:acyl-CoA thioesterase-1